MLIDRLEIYTKDTNEIILEVVFEISNKSEHKGQITSISGEGKLIAEKILSEKRLYTDEIGNSVFTHAPDEFWWIHSALSVASNILGGILVAHLHDGESMDPRPYLNNKNQT